MTDAAFDRLSHLLEQDKVTGIDFVDVPKQAYGSVSGNENEVFLHVHFYKFRDPGTSAKAILGTVQKKNVHIFYPGQEPLQILKDPEWVDVYDHILKITTEKPPQLVRYRLRIDNPKIDGYYNEVEFLYNAHCESDVDCGKQPHTCPQEEVEDFPVDYRARDFWSLRRALMDFAAQRYPEWRDRDREASLVNTIAEAFCALADEMAYTQDRIAREAFLKTATQRRSLRGHARLMDYSVHDGMGSSTWLQIKAKNNMKGFLPEGFEIKSVFKGGHEVPFEIGMSIKDRGEEKKYWIDHRRNKIEVHTWDDEDTCLPVGATELHICDPSQKIKDFEKMLGWKGASDKREKCNWVLLRTYPDDPTKKVRVWPVRLINVKNNRDNLRGENIALLKWEPSQAIPFEMDKTDLKVHGNLVPISAGRTRESMFVIRDFPPDEDIPASEKEKITRAVERLGPDGTTTYLFSLPDTNTEGLVWRPPIESSDDPIKIIPVNEAYPEIILKEVQFVGGQWRDIHRWEWRRSLLGFPSSGKHHGYSSGKNDAHFTFDDGTWRRVVGYWRNGQEIEHIDYAEGEGFTIRFGDGMFGRNPDLGKIFRVQYRIGNGSKTNIPENALLQSYKKDDLIEGITNPLPAVNGLDPESPEQVRMNAPHKWRELPLRAVRQEDYAQAAERLAWVQRAGGVFRWTGSWFSAFVTPDPRDSVEMTEEQNRELHDQLGRFRQAGREAHVTQSRYADLDLEVIVCVDPAASPGQVKELVMEALTSNKDNGKEPYFSPDNFTFGRPLSRSSLEALINSVPGVRAVKQIKIRRKGHHDWMDLSEVTYGSLAYEVNTNEVIRVENDPLHPHRGSVAVRTEGGA